MHESPQVQRQARLRAQMNDSPRVRAQVQLQAMFGNRPREMARPRREATPGRDYRVPVQREIGDGGIVNLWREAFHISGRRLRITGHTMFLGEVHYTVEDSGGNSRLARGSDPHFSLDGVFPTRTPIAFTVARRESGRGGKTGGPRTNTYFVDTGAAMNTLITECGVPENVAREMSGKHDWSYPDMQSLMRFLESTDSVQPGFNEGVRLWQEAQPSFKYAIQTTARGSQLAQIVGCHMMEYQETNNATQGKYTSQDMSRKQQLEFSEAISRLPPEQIPLHTLGIGGGRYTGMFPAMFDVKYEEPGQKTFTKPASGKTFKTFQSAILARDEEFGYQDTLDPEARADRKEALTETLEGEKFRFDRLMRRKSRREKKEKEKKRKSTKKKTVAFDDDYAMEEDVETPQNFLAEEFGITGDDSDASLEADDDWEFPRTLESVGTWTLEEFYQYVYKTNVYSGVISKEYSAKLAELDIMSSNPLMEFDTSTMQEIDVATHRRQGVQDRVESFNTGLSQLLGQLDIDVGRIYKLVTEWKNKKGYLDERASGSKSANRTARERKRALRRYGRKSLLKLKAEGYPLPLPGLGEATLKQ